MHSSCVSSNSRSGTAGFSLVELAITMGLLAVALLALLSLVPTAHQQLKTAMDTTTAAQIARSVMSEFQTAGLGEVLRLGRMEGANARRMTNLPAQYFTSTGREVAQDELDRAYHVNTRILRDKELSEAAPLDAARGRALLTIEVVAVPAGVPVVIGVNGLVDRTRFPFAIATYVCVVAGHSAR
jgi:uncharacterized protein (TIGR02598 family)